MQWTSKQISVISVVAITSFMGTFLISSINIALPAIEQTFGLNAVTLSWVISAFLLATAMFLLPAGKLADIAGIRRLFKTGLFVFTAASLLCGLSGSGTQLISFRFLQGIGAALTTTTGPAILVTSFSQQHRGAVLGIAVAAVYLGLAFGPFAGGLLTEYAGWRSIFYVSVFLGALAILFSMLYLGRDDANSSHQKTPLLRGTVFYMLGLIALVYGSSEIPDLHGWLLIAGGIAALILFWNTEHRSPRPVIETRLYTRNRLFAFSNLAALINYSATFAIVFLLSLYLQKTQGLSPRHAGLVLVAQPAVMALFSPVAGRLSDRIQPRYLTAVGMTICTTGLAAFSFLTGQTSLAFIIGVLIWVGLGFALFSSPNMNTIMSSVDKSRFGLASGSAATMRVLGQIVSMSIATLFFAAIMGKTALEKVPDALFLKAVSLAFICFAVINAAGIYFAFQRGNLTRSNS